MGTEVIVDQLDYLYQYDMDKYLSEVSDLKRMGYKIYRNNDGKHKLVAPQRERPRYNAYGMPNIDFGNDAINDLFGGIFNGSK